MLRTSRHITNRAACSLRPRPPARRATTGCCVCEAMRALKGSGVCRHHHDESDDCALTAWFRLGRTVSYRGRRRRQWPTRGVVVARAGSARRALAARAAERRRAPQRGAGRETHARRANGASARRSLTQHMAPHQLLRGTDVRGGGIYGRGLSVLYRGGARGVGGGPLSSVISSCLVGGAVGRSVFHWRARVRLPSAVAGGGGGGGGRRAALRLGRLDVVCRRRRQRRPQLRRTRRRGEGGARGGVRPGRSGRRGRTHPREVRMF